MHVADRLFRGSDELVGVLGYDGANCRRRGVVLDDGVRRKDFDPPVRVRSVMFAMAVIMMCCAPDDDFRAHVPVPPALDWALQVPEVGLEPDKGAADKGAHPQSRGNAVRRGG